MQREEAKPFIEIGGQPILGHTVRRFLPLAGLGQIIVATSSDYLVQCESIMEQTIGSAVSWRCVKGGTERQHSVRLGLQQVSDAELVLVHDAVRPFVTAEEIAACCEEAEQSGAAVLGMPSKDTVKLVGEDRYIEHTPDRSRLWQVQTPQVFKTDLLRRAHNEAAAVNFLGTDDASLVEWLGEPVRMVRGSARNIKITYPQDLQMAALLLENANDK